MDKNDAVKILASLKAAYPESFKTVKERDGYAMIDLWAKMFADEDYSTVNAAIYALIATRTVGYSPTVGEVKEKIQSIKQQKLMPENEAWAIVSRACANGLYGYQKEFDKMPPEVQRAVGSPEQLRAWAAMDAETVQSVVASNFMRAYRTQAARENEMAMLPTEVRAVIGQISDRLRLTGGDSYEDLPAL